MELDPTIKAIILIAIAVGLGLVIYFEMRYMRRKRASKIDSRMVRDDAYNCLVTTRAIARVLDERGKDTSKAEQLIFQAENAYSREDYQRTKQLAEDARKELEVCGDRETPGDDLEIKPAIVLAGPCEEEGEPLDKKTLYEEEKNLPENYMQAKFMIRSVQKEMNMAEAADTATAEAEGHLKMALERFDQGEYTEALRFACRADKCLSLSGTRFIGMGKTPDAQAQEPVERDAWMEDAPMSGGPSEAVCRECGSSLEEEDAFCARCGTRVERERRCTECESLLREGDAFCRKCGSRVQ